MSKGVFKKAVVASVITSMLAGCTTPVVLQTEIDNHRVGGQIKENLEKIPEQEKKVAYINKSDEIFAVGKSFAIKNDELPKQLYRQVSVNRDVEGMKGLVDRISMLSGMPVYYFRELTAAATASAPATGGMMGGGMMGGGMMGGGMMGGGMGMNNMFNPMTMIMQQQNMPYADRTFTLSYNGTFIGLLDVLMTRYGYYWKYKDGRIFLYETESRVFEVATVSGKMSTQAQLSSDAQTGEDSGGENKAAKSTTGSNSTTTTESTIDVWPAIEANVKQMLTPKGKLAVSPSTGNITVTDIPEVLARVEEYVDQENRALSRQVAISVKVLTIENTASDDYGLSWTNVRRSLKNAGYDFRSNGSLSSDVPNLAVNILTGKFAGASALISAISEKSKINSVTNFSAITMNNQAVPINVGNQLSYLAKVESTTDATTGSVTMSLTPGVVSTGTNMSVMPRIMRDGTILLQFNMNISSLVGDLKTFGPAGNQIQLPEVASKNFLQRASLRSGETLVLSGFESSLGSSDRSGVGIAENPLLGGGMKGKDSRTSIVVIVEPILLDAER